MPNTTLTLKVNKALADLTAEIKNNQLQIPSPPDLLIKVRAVIANKEKGLKNIVELVKLDPNISGRLIKVANCALLPSRYQATDVKSAVSRLGASKVQSLVTSLIIAQNFMKYRTKNIQTYFDAAWQQSNNVAAINYVLAAKKTNIDPEHALLAGIVHNIGVLPLVLRLNEIPLFKAQPELFHKVANAVIPKLYPKAGKLILDKWNFPKETVGIALSHTKIMRESTGIIDINDITLISSELNKLSDFTDVDVVPESLISSPTFLKLWDSWEDASNDLRRLRPEINDMKQDISS